MSISHNCLQNVQGYPAVLINFGIYFTPVGVVLKYLSFIVRPTLISYEAE